MGYIISHRIDLKWCGFFFERLAAYTQEKFTQVPPFQILCVLATAVPTHFTYSPVSDTHSTNNTQASCCMMYV